MYLYSNSLATSQNFVLINVNILYIRKNCVSIEKTFLGKPWNLSKDYFTVNLKIGGYLM